MSEDFFKFSGKLKKPHAITSSEAYLIANRDMLLPIPATPLNPNVFKIFNQIIGGGLRPREFTIICGATGSGKTTFIANISKCFVLDKIPHFVASVETGPADYIRRVMSAISGFDFNSGEAISLGEAKSFNKEYGPYFNANTLHLSLYEDRFPVEQLTKDILWMVEHHKIKVAIIDNLNFFLEVTSASNAVIEMDRVIHELIIFCKQVDVHIIMIMHPKKTEHGRVESEFDIKGSSTAVQEAHNVFLWNRPSKKYIENGGSPRDRELYIAKMRRRGAAIGKRLMFLTTDTVSYNERGLI